MGRHSPLKLFLKIFFYIYRARITLSTLAF